MPVYERISAVVSLTLIGLGLYFVLEFPRQVAAFTLLDSPLALVAPRQWLMAFLLSALAMAGTDAVMRAHPDLVNQRLPYLMTFWTLPGLLVILATQTLGLAPTTIAWAAGLVGVGILLWVTIIAQFRWVASNGGPRWVRLWQLVIGYGVALFLFVIIYYTRNRSALSATAVSLVGTMVALALLRQKPENIFRTWLFAVVIGLSMGQITWALNYWRIGALRAGLLLLLILYVFIGLVQQRLFDTLTRRVLLEFGAVTVAALLLIFYL